MRAIGKATVSLACLLLLSACSQPKAVSICQMQAAPKSYMGKRVIIHGEVYSDRHGASLFDSECPNTSVSLGVGSPDSEDFVAQAYANGPDRTVNGRHMFAAIAGTCVKDPQFGGCVFMVDRVFFTKTVQGKPGARR